MSRQPLALKYRPRSWNDLIGQPTLTIVIKSMARKGQIHQFLLFGGTRGSGKTSAARILARTLNCYNLVDGYDPCNKCEACMSITDGSSTDILEIDAASHGDVESARTLRESLLYPPMMLTKRLVILDEAHAMTSKAFDTLLKVLEEPPAHSHILMATTAISKIPDTIISRSIPFEFRRIPTIEIQKRIAQIAQLENISITPDALWLIAEHAEGGVRNAITTLEQLSVLEETITPELVSTVLGTITTTDTVQLIQNLIDDNTVGAQLWIRNQIRRGADPAAILTALLNHTTNMITSTVGYRSDTTDELARKTLAQATALGQLRLNTLLDELLQIEARLGHSPIPSSTYLDAALTRIQTILLQQSPTKSSKAS